MQHDVVLYARVRSAVGVPVVCQHMHPLGGSLRVCNMNATPGSKKTPDFKTLLKHSGESFSLWLR